MPSVSGSVDAVSDWGFSTSVGSAAANSLAWRTGRDAVVAASPALGLTLNFPAGTFRFDSKDPPLIDIPLRIKGAGSHLTTFTLVDGNGSVQTPCLVPGIHEVDGGKTVLSAHRPDPFGVLDSTLVAGAGLVRGFATNGDAFVAFPPVGTSLAVGPQTSSSTGKSWGYWSNVTAFCLEVALKTSDLAGLLADASQPCIVGIGGASTPGAYYLCGDGAGHLLFSFGTSDGGVYSVRFTTTATGPLYRLRMWYDLPSGTYGVAVGGSAATVTTAPSAFAGKSPFRNSRAGRSPWIGPAGSTAVAFNKSGRSTVPSFQVLAFRVSNVARTTEGADDAHRYGLDSHTVAYFPDPHEGTAYTNRCLRVALNPSLCNGWIAATGIVQQVNPSAAGGVGPVQISGINFGTVGAAMWLGQYLDLALADLSSGDGVRGYAALGIETTAYPFEEDGCAFGGSDGGRHLYNCADYVIDRPKMTAPGASYGTFYNSAGVVRDGLTTFTSDTLERILDHPLCQRGAVDGLAVDNEDRQVTDALICWERNPGVTTLASARGVTSAFVGTGASAYHLEDYPGGGGSAGVADLGATATGNGGTPTSGTLLNVGGTGVWDVILEDRGQFSAVITGDPSAVAVPGNGTAPGPTGVSIVFVRVS